MGASIFFVCQVTWLNAFILRFLSLFHNKFRFVFPQSSNVMSNLLSLGRKRIFPFNSTNRTINGIQSVVDFFTWKISRTKDYTIGMYSICFATSLKANICISLFNEISLQILGSPNLPWEFLRPFPNFNVVLNVLTYFLGLSMKQNHRLL